MGEIFGLFSPLKVLLKESLCRWYNWRGDAVYMTIKRLSCTPSLQSATAHCLCLHHFHLLQLIWHSRVSDITKFCLIFCRRLLLRENSYIIITICHHHHPHEHHHPPHEHHLLGGSDLFLEVLYAWQWHYAWQLLGHCTVVIILFVITILIIIVTIIISDKSLAWTSSWFDSLSWELISKVASSDSASDFRINTSSSSSLKS